jgi:hypothetical protein
VQDTHFSLTAADGPGRADPVETHCRENDDFARTALDMSEQTCFLHALLKADLRVRVRAQGFDGGDVPVAAA